MASSPTEGRRWRTVRRARTYNGNGSPTPWTITHALRIQDLFLTLATLQGHRKIDQRRVSIPVG
eukprot:5944850-Pleurochrysis_carterae.AAC.1